MLSCNSIAPEKTIMKNIRLHVAVALLPLLAGVAAWAQTTQPAVEDFKPSTLNQSGRQYPQVNSEGRARFRIAAPKAQSVKSSFSGGNRVGKGAEGAWLIT